MNTIINTIISIIMAFSISGGVAGIAEVDPIEAAQDFVDGICNGDQQLTACYMDNEYVNFLENVKGNDKEMDRLKEELFKNVEFEVVETAIRGDVAVVKAKITTKDFSKTMDEYEKESYKYVMDNLYDEKATDKELLNKKCLDIYLEQIEKTAENGETIQTEIFIPMEDDGYYGWRIILNDDIMKALMGGLDLPVSK